MENKNKVLPYILIFPSILLMVVVISYPVVICIIDSLKEDDGTIGLGNFTYFLTDDIQVENIIYTLKIVIITVVLTIVIAYFIAIYLRFSNTLISKLVGKLYILPRFIPGLVAVNGMITIIRDSGLINRISNVFGKDFKLGFMYNEKGIILMNLWFCIPFATMLLASSLSIINDSEIESAKDVGASKIRIFLDIIFPLTYKEIFVTATFIFMSNVSSFTTPYLMGAQHPTMLGITLFNQYNMSNYSKAAALSIIMFLISSVSAAVYVYVNMKESQWEKSSRN